MPVKRRLARTKVLSPEVNAKDFLITRTVAGTPIANGHNDLYQDATNNHLTAIERGDGDVQRVGSKFKPISIQLMGHLSTTQGNPTLAPHDRTFRLSLVRNRNPKGAAFTVSQVYSSNGPDDSTLRQKDYTAEYQVLWTRLYHLKPSEGLAWDATNAYFQHGIKVAPIDAYIKLPDDCITTWKDAQAQDLSNCLENSLHLVGSCDVAGTLNSPNPPFELTLNVRIRFLDM